MTTPTHQAPPFEELPPSLQRKILFHQVMNAGRQPFTKADGKLLTELLARRKALPEDAQASWLDAQIAELEFRMEEEIGHQMMEMEMDM